MNMFKKNGGFTLVELIVVIAILAGVAVPAYTGYIQKAEEASALQTLSAINTAAQGLAIAEQDAVEEIAVTDGEISVTCKNGTDINEAVLELLGDNFDLSDVKKDYTWTADTNKWEPAA